MSYLVFARKFRPQRFEDVVGQEPITATLQNAILEKRIAQSFLFSGTRGVGKTSTARILAKALNCEKGIVPEPCGQCQSCQEITQGNSLDVLEVDGASNRGIDEIRSLRESVKFKPLQGRFKIYIIDEVHMLTQEAFNALLKTLEEPPEHVKFIFATTEIQKVPPTILSRCQKFVFRKVPAVRIVKKLSVIAEAEKLKADEKSLFAVAKAAEGSLRDAEGLLDQLASFAEGKITYAKVIEAFGLPSEEVYLALLDAILAQDTAKTLEIFSPLALEGKDMIQFVRGLGEIFRALLILKVAGSRLPDLIDFNSETLRELEIKKDKFSKEDLLSIVSFLQNLLRDVRRSPVPELQVETALIRLAIREQLASVSEMMEKIEELRKSTFTPAEKPVFPPQKSAQPASKDLSVKSGTGKQLSGDTNSFRSGPAAVLNTAWNEKPGLPQQMPAVEPASGLEKGILVAEGSSKLPENGLTLNTVERVWPEIVETVKSRKMSCGMYLSESEPVEIEGDLVVLGLPSEFKFHKESLEKGENRKIVEEVFHSFFAAKFRISFVITVPEKTGMTPASHDEGDQKLPDIVESAVQLFKGKIVRRG